MTEHASGGVADYYDANTRRFLRFGQGGSVGAIHRAVWGPGVRTREEAFHYAHARLLALMPERAQTILDLGCGVGATLEYLARRRPVSGIGVTLSDVQVRLARQRFEQAGLSDRLRCERADFAALPRSVAETDFAFGIESFVHAPQPDPFFAEVARVLRPGGVLAVCDDFASDRLEGGRLSFREARWAQEFRRGWGVSPVSVGRACEVAARHGLRRVSNEDLTPDVELRRPRDKLITAMVRLGRHVPTRSPWWRNMLGGNALQMLLLRRLITYRIVAWTRA